MLVRVNGKETQRKRKEKNKRINIDFPFIFSDTVRREDHFNIIKAHEIEEQHEVKRNIILYQDWKTS